MNIKNYTSSVPATNSINDIEKILLRMGARNIMKEYDKAGNKVVSIVFSIPQQGSVVPVKLPGRVEAVKSFMMKKYKKRVSKEMETNAMKQAERTAWKNVKEWIELQETMINLDQVEFMEVFMPYIYRMDQGKTIYEIAKENHFQKLLMS